MVRAVWARTGGPGGPVGLGGPGNGMHFTLKLVELHARCVVCAAMCAPSLFREEVTSSIETNASESKQNMRGNSWAPQVLLGKRFMKFTLLDAVFHRTQKRAQNMQKRGFKCTSGLQIPLRPPNA